MRLKEIGIVISAIILILWVVIESKLKRIKPTAEFSTGITPIESLLFATRGQISEIVCV